MAGVSSRKGTGALSVFIAATGVRRPLFVDAALFGMRAPRCAMIAYHEASKHHVDRYAPGPGRLDWATQPDPFRTFAGTPRVVLPLRADALPAPFESVRRGRRGFAQPVDLDSLATLLELALGLSAWKEHGGARWALRCNPSSGNLHPTEGYLVCGPLPGLPAGVHHYVSRDHALEQRATPSALRWGEELEPGAVIALTSIHWREAWKYGLRAYRYCQHDCGHAIGALAYAAAALGWQARILSGWGDDDLAALLGLDRPQDFADAEPEAPEIALWVGPGPMPASGWPTPPSPARSSTFVGVANRLSAGHREWPGIAEAERIAHRPGGLAVPGYLPAPIPPLAGSGSVMSAATLIRQRRSAVAFDAVTTLPAGRFFGMLDALLPRPGVPPLDAWPQAPRVHAAIFVHRVDGIAPGLCVLLRNRDAIARLRAAMRADWAWEAVAGAPAHLPLYRLAEGDARDAARTIACHQEIAADSCFALGFVAEFAGPLESGPWNYRELFWESGLLGQILYLEAEAAGVRATGIGCYFDDAMHRLLGLEDFAWQSLYHFTVGGPVDDPRLRTHPPYAHLRR